MTYSFIITILRLPYPFDPYTQFACLKLSLYWVTEQLQVIMRPQTKLLHLIPILILSSINLCNRMMILFFLSFCSIFAQSHNCESFWLRIRWTWPKLQVNNSGDDQVPDPGLEPKSGSVQKHKQSH